jgi:hypothetical protein
VYRLPQREDVAILILPLQSWFAQGHHESKTFALKSECLGAATPRRFLCKGGGSYSTLAGSMRQVFATGTGRGNSLPVCEDCCGAALVAVLVITEHLWVEVSRPEITSDTED